MRVLITGDDGPPGPTSPYVLGLWSALVARGWDVAVVLPSAQKSWGGMHFQAHSPVGVWYYYPRLLDVDESLWNAGTGSWSPVRRPVDHAAGELGEWVLLDASPASCANAGVYNHATLLPPADGAAPAAFDLVVTGPNFGRNTGTSFALGSGTIGSALAASLTGTKAIALSFAHFQTLPVDPPHLRDAHHRLAPQPLDPADSTDSPQLPDHLPQMQHKVVQAAIDKSVEIVEHLYRNWEAGVRAYSVNVPIAWAVLDTKAIWTKMWVGQHARLYLDPAAGASPDVVHGAGFSDLPATSASTADPYQPSCAPVPARRLLFRPDMKGMLAPTDLEPGTDICSYFHRQGLGIYR